MRAAATREKVRRLRDQATLAGEREAAENALARLGREPPRPPVGSAAYVKAVLAHRDIVGFCSVNRDVAELSRQEVKVILNFCRYHGTPWEDDAEELRRIARKITGAGR